MQGQNTKGPQEYSELFAYRFCQALATAIAEGDPHRFITRPRDDVHYRAAAGHDEWSPPADAKPASAYFVDINRDLNTWIPIIQAPLSDMTNHSRVSWNISPEHPTDKTCVLLVPWCITRIQPRHMPKTGRLPIGFEYNHRAAIPLHKDEQYSIEAERLVDIAFPRKRFVKPVKFALFIYVCVCVRIWAPARQQHCRRRAQRRRMVSS